MPMYDRVCEDGHEMLDLYETIGTTDVACKECGKPAKRVILAGRATSVTPDDIPGGLAIRHGLCNEDGTPRVYYSKSEIAAEAKRRGLVNLVEHTPERGSDKSRHTVRWV